MERKYATLKVEYGNRGLRKMSTYKKSQLAKPDLVNNILTPRDMLSLKREERFTLLEQSKEDDLYDVSSDDSERPGRKSALRDLKLLENIEK